MPIKPQETEPLATESEAAEFLRFTPRALQARRLKGEPPRFVRLSARAVRYRWSDLREFVEGSVRASTADPGPSET